MQPTRHAHITHIPRVTQEFFPAISGPANQALALARGLERRGIASPILTTTLGDDPRTADLTVRRFAPFVELANFRPAWGLQRQLLREPANVLHVHGWRNPASDGAIMAAARRGIPLIVQAHGVAYGYQFSHSARMLRTVRHMYETVARENVLRHADVVVASTQQEAEELRRYGFDSQCVVVIPSGVDPSFFAKRPMTSRAGITLLVVGRLGARRNIEQTIQALAVLRVWGYDVRLRVVGPEVTLAAGDPLNYQVQLRSLAAACGVTQAVQCIDARQGADLVAEYHAADVFISTSRYENFGQPVAEAAAAGLPIVATPTGIARELLENGEAGTLVPVDDISATAMALQQLCDNADLRWRMGQAAQQAARQQFDWSRIVPRYVELYEQVLEHHRGSVCVHQSSIFRSSKRSASG